MLGRGQPIDVLVESKLLVECKTAEMLPLVFAREQLIGGPVLLRGVEHASIIPIGGKLR